MDTSGYKVKESLHNTSVKAAKFLLVALAEALHFINLFNKSYIFFLAVVSLNVFSAFFHNPSFRFFALKTLQEYLTSLLGNAY